MSFLLDNLFNFKNKSGIVNVRMVITEEKILSNIEKVQKMINPNSKKQIVQLEEDTYFKDLVESIKTYLEEYPKKKNFPRSVYRAAYDLVEFATNQFEDNTKKIEQLIIQREKNIGLAYELKDTLNKIVTKAEGYEGELESAEVRYGEDIVEALKLIANGTEEEQAAAKKLVEARVNNLESNFHIEIDMERIEDKSKALSYIGIEIAEALKYIPVTAEELTNTPLETTTTTTPVQQYATPVTNNTTVKQNVAAATPVTTKQEKKVNNPILSQPVTAETTTVTNTEGLLNDMYMKETRFDVKPSLWQRFKNSKIVRTIRYIMKIRVVLDLPALPEGRGENDF